MSGYELQSQLGRGGYSSVYAARQLSVNRVVALKVIAAPDLDEEVERRFRAEAEAIGNLSWHPHVVVLHDAGFAEDGSPYLAMELMPAGSIGARIKATGALEPPDALRVATEVADALAAAHEAHILHRDVKPDNILMGRRGQAVLSDFGIATLYDGTASSTATFAGTYAFSAPELLNGRRATPRTDVYSLGATLYSMLAGRHAYASNGEETPAALMWRIVSEPPPPLPETIPAPVVAVVERAMSRDPQARHASAALLKRSLEQAAAALAASAGGPRLRGTVAPGPSAPAAPANPAPAAAGPATPGPASYPPPAAAAHPPPAATPPAAAYPPPAASSPAAAYPPPAATAPAAAYPPPGAASHPTPGPATYPPPGATYPPPGSASVPGVGPEAASARSRAEAWSLPAVVALLAIGAVVILVLALTR